MDKKKVMLITLPAEKKCGDWRAPDYYKTTKSAKYVPLGLLSLATNNPGRHPIKILDASAYGLSIEETIKNIEDEKPDILGIHSLTERVYAMKEILKRTTAPYKIVGGPHVTHYSELTLKQGADCVLVGHLADKEFSKAIENIPKGIVQCKTKISEIKFPDRELIDIDFYIPKEFTFFESEKRMVMFSSIGCPNKCTFCDVESKKIERKSPEKIVEEMEYLYKLGSRSIHVFDDNFNVNERHLDLVMDEMEKKNFHIEWSGRGQAKMSGGLTKRLAENGFKRIHVGLESLDEKVLKFFNKKVNLGNIEKFCNTMNKYGVDILAYFIVGTPVETELYRKELKNKVKELGIKHPYIQILYPAPNTIYYQQLLDKGVYKKDLWKEFMENPTPNFVPPYPYDKNLLGELINYVDEFEEEYRKDKNEKVI